MKHEKFSENQNQATLPDQTMEQNEDGMDLATSEDEVARRAYFSYVNQGSSQGHEVQHWLEAERQLLAERNLTRTHGHPHHTTHHQKS